MCIRYPYFGLIRYLLRGFHIRADYTEFGTGAGSKAALFLKGVFLLEKTGVADAQNARRRRTSDWLVFAATCVLCALVFSFSAVAPALSSVRAAGEGEGDGGGDDEKPIVTIYHDHFIPWMSGADNCWGAYRIVVSEGEASRSSFDGTEWRKYSGGWNFSGEGPSMHAFDIRSAARDDLFVLTDFALGAMRTDPPLDVGWCIEIHVHTFYYETPFLYVGKTTRTGPTHGVAGIPDDGGRSSFMFTRDNVWKYFEEEIDKESFTALLTPGFAGAYPPGKIIKNVDVAYDYKVHLWSIPEDLPETVGWWRMFTTDLLAIVDRVRKNPNEYVRTPTEAELADLKRAFEKAWGEDKGKATPPEYSIGSPGGVPVPRGPYEAGYSWWTPRMFYSPTMFASFSRQTLEKIHRGARPYLFPWNFLTPEEMRAVWTDAAAGLVISAEKEIPKPTRTTTTIDMTSMGGFSAVPRSEKKLVSESFERVLLPFAVKPPFSAASSLDILRSTYPGSWNASPSGTGGVAVTSHSASSLARWPFFMAQYELWRTGLSSMGSLAGNGKDDSATRSVVASGGALKLLTASGDWTPPPAFESAGEGLPVAVKYFDSAPAVVTAPGKSPSGSSPWEYWARKNRIFHDTVMPYISPDLMLMFWKETGDKGLYFGKSMEKIFLPEVFYSFNNEFDRKHSISGDETTKAASSLETSPETSPERFMAMKKDFLASPLLKNPISGELRRKGREHLSHIVRTRSIFIPANLSVAKATLSSIREVAEGLSRGTIRFPSESVLRKMRVYFPIDASAATTTSWPGPSVPK